MLTVLLTLFALTAPIASKETRVELTRTIAFKTPTTITATTGTPRVSLITSLYGAALFIEGFLADMVRQTIFPECELIIIDANSPDRHIEEPIIRKYCARYSNIIYVQLDHDPGLYAVWNLGVDLARAPLVGNANTDDRRNPMSLERQVILLENNPHVSLAYTDFYVSYIPNATFEESLNCFLYTEPLFAPEKMEECIPGPMPVWRKELHVRYGKFDESFSSSGDHEYWNRIVAEGRGRVHFAKILGVGGVYYLNPDGVSTNKDPVKSAKREREVIQIREKYQHLWRKAK